MKHKLFATLVKKDHILHDSDYVAGRISAAIRIICDTDEIYCYGLPKDSDWMETNGTCYTVATTPDRYATFVSTIEKWYPGLCEFYYPFDKVNVSLPSWL